MRHALQRLGCQREETVIIGDRMDTDIVAGTFFTEGSILLGGS